MAKKPQRQKYVVGFMLDPTLSKVVLIRKLRPECDRVGGIISLTPEAIWNSSYGVAASI
jgi:hypothetical protein